MIKEQEKICQRERCLLMSQAMEEGAEKSTEKLKVQFEEKESETSDSELPTPHEFSKFGLFESKLFKVIKDMPADMIRTLVEQRRQQRLQESELQ